MCVPARPVCWSYEPAAAAVAVRPRQNDLLNVLREQTKRKKLNQFILRVRGEKNNRKYAKRLIEIVYVLRMRRFFSSLFFNVIRSIGNLTRYGNDGLRC